MDFYEETALKLIGMEVALSKEFKQFPDGYTTGRARISRKCLKSNYNITSQIQLDSLRDALSDKGYVLVELDYASDLFLINIRNFLSNTRIINSEAIEKYTSRNLIDYANTYLTFQAKEREKEKELKNE